MAEFPIRERTRERSPFRFGSYGDDRASSGSATPALIGSLIGANFNITTDQSITLSTGTWRITEIMVTNASTSLTTAAGGFYPSASKAGTAIVAASQVYSALVNSTVRLNCTIASYASVTTPIYFALTTGQGVAATADIRVYGYKVG